MRRTRKLKAEEIARLTAMYVEEHMSAMQVARHLGMMQSTVLKYLKRAGAIRPHNKDVDPAELVRLYVDEHLSAAEIGEHVGMATNSVLYHLRKAKVVRYCGWKTRKMPTMDLARMYFDEGMSLSDIAEETSLHKGTIRRRLATNGYELRAPMTKGWVNPKLAPNRRPTILDIAWAAGVYEGEGSVTYRVSAYGNGLRSPIVSVTQKDDWLCAQLRELFGGTDRKHGKASGREYNYWRLTGVRALGFLMTIYTLLSPRRQQQIRDAFTKAGINQSQTRSALAV